VRGDCTGTQRNAHSILESPHTQMKGTNVSTCKFPEERIFFGTDSLVPAEKRGAKRVSSKLFVGCMRLDGSSNNRFGCSLLRLT
jgi:hypothetical protein